MKKYQKMSTARIRNLITETTHIRNQWSDNRRYIHKRPKICVFCAQGQESNGRRQPAAENRWYWGSKGLLLCHHSSSLQNEIHQTDPESRTSLDFETHFFNILRKQGWFNPKMMIVNIFVLPRGGKDFIWIFFFLSTNIWYEMENVRTSNTNDLKINNFIFTNIFTSH